MSDTETDRIIAGHRPILERIRARRAREAEARQRRVEHRVRMRVLEIEHQIRLDAIRREAAAARRQDEEAVAADIDRAMEIYQSPILRGTGKRPARVAMRWHRMRMESSGPPIEPYHSHIVGLAAARKIEIRWVAKPGVNAYALHYRAIEIAPIRSEWSFGVALHEAAHIERPCEAHHRRARPKTGPGTVCVACEVTAWTLATELAQPNYWTRAMHAALQESLPTYRPYGTPDEQRVIDEMCTNRWAAEVRLKRAMG